MSSTSPILAAAACQRPSTLYRYSEQRYLERSLQFGEFRLRPVAAEGLLSLDGQMAPAAYLTLSLAAAWDERLFTEFGEADCCLVLHDVEQFGERIHRAAQRMLPGWTGIDAAVSYGAPSPLGRVFSKLKASSWEREWLFAWRPIQPRSIFHSVTLSIGGIEDIAELRRRSV